MQNETKIDRCLDEAVDGMPPTEERRHLSETCDMRGLAPESWKCIDCHKNTAPGMLNRVELEAAIAALGERWDKEQEGVPQRIGFDSEVYTVRNAVWKAARMEPYGGCLCIGCLEKRLGRRLRPKDFQRNHPFNRLPGTDRLKKRRGWWRGQQCL
jgi:hypothetical protein